MCDHGDLRSELKSQGVDSSSLQFTFNWFQNDLTNKGSSSIFYASTGDYPKSTQKMTTSEQLKTYAYLSFLRTNSYIQSGDDNYVFLFPEMLKAANYCLSSTKSKVKLDEVLLFFQMLRFKFPGGDFLSTPQNLQHIESDFSCFKGTDLPSVD